MRREFNMPFVQAKCENCGAVLTVDSNLKAAICNHCGAAYVVQDSINYYNSFTKVEHMHANVVNISDESSSEGRLKAAEAFMKLRKYDEAKIEYRKVTALIPQDCRGWSGLIDATTHGFTARITDKKTIDELEDWATALETIAPKGVCDSFLESYKQYITSERVKNAEAKANTTTELSQLKEQVNMLISKEKEIQKLLNTNRIALTRVTQKANSINPKEGEAGPRAFFLILGVLGVIVGGSVMPNASGLGIILIILAIICFILCIWFGTKKHRVLKNRDFLIAYRSELEKNLEDTTSKKNQLLKQISERSIELTQYE
ncbi:MAG: hypothetical protein IJ869_06885 [Clostridiales bacterium]|nr:hypothetical protein [Clostridiales bacterium]